MTTSQQVLTLSCQEQTNEYLTTHHLRFTSLPPLSLPPSVSTHAVFTVCHKLQVSSIRPLSRSQVAPVKEIKRFPRPRVCVLLKERDLSVPRQVRATSKPCTVCSVQTPQTWHFWSIVLPAPVSFILSPFDLCVRSLILLLQTPLHAHIFHYPSLFSCCHPHSILAKTLLFKFTLLCTSLTLSCFPSEPKPSQRSQRNGQPPPAFPFI